MLGNIHKVKSTILVTTTLIWEEMRFRQILESYHKNIFNNLFSNSLFIISLSPQSPGSLWWKFKNTLNFENVFCIKKQTKQPPVCLPWTRILATFIIWHPSGGYLSELHSYGWLRVSVQHGRPPIRGLAVPSQARLTCMPKCPWARHLTPASLLLHHCVNDDMEVLWVVEFSSNYI